MKQPKPAAKAKPEKRPSKEDTATLGPGSSITEDAYTSAWTAHDYTVVREKDNSSSVRKRRHVWIRAPTAQTPEARIATLMEAAVRVQRESFPQYVEAFLLPFEAAPYPMASIRYAPDGCGVSGSDCTDDRWTNAKAAEGGITEMQMAIRKEWEANRDQFKDANGWVDEPRLYQFLADKHSTTTEALRAEMLGFLVAIDPVRIGLPRDVREKGELTEDEHEKLAEVACRADLQCWGDKHHLRATQPCPRAIEK